MFSCRTRTDSDKGSGRGLFSFFKSLTSGRTITKDSMIPVMEKMKEHLISKGYSIVLDIGNGCGQGTPYFHR